MPKNYYRIKEVLEDKGKTQEWLAESLGVDAVTISRYCNGHREPSMERLHDISKLLKVKIKDLIND